jgi:hypothetical protein
LHISSPSFHNSLTYFGDATSAKEKGKVKTVVVSKKPFTTVPHQSLVNYLIEEFADRDNRFLFPTMEKKKRKSKQHPTSKKHSKPHVKSKKHRPHHSASSSSPSSSNASSSTSAQHQS